MIDTTFVLVLAAAISISVLIPLIQRRRSKHSTVEKELPKGASEDLKLSKPIIEKFFLATGASKISPGAGKHLSRGRMFYTSDSNKMGLFASYVWEGLFGGDRVVYVYPDDEEIVVRKKLREYGIDVAKHERNGSLLLIPLSKVYLSSGSFDKNKSLAFWRELRAETKRKGYKHERHLIDLGDLSFMRDREEKYFSYLREEIRMQLLDPYLVELRAVDRGNLQQRHIDEFKFYNTRFIELFRLADAFSKTLKLSHQEMVGRKVLFEFDPASRYEKAIRDFAVEAMANVEKMIVFTRKGSTIHSSLNGEKDVKLFSLTEHVSTPQEVSKNETLLPSTDTSIMLDSMDRTLKEYPYDVVNFVFDNLSDLVLSIGFETTYRFTKYVAEILASPRVTSLFLLNQAAHDPAVVQSLRGLFNNHISFGKRGIQTLKLSRREVDGTKMQEV